MSSLSDYNMQRKKETRKNLMYIGFVFSIFQMGFIAFKLYIPLEQNIPWWQVMLPISVVVLTYIMAYMMILMGKCCDKEPRETDLEQCLTGFAEEERESIEV